MKSFLVAYTILLLCKFIPPGMLQLPPSSQTCTKEGRYEIVDGTCENYYMCIYTGVGYEAYNLKCPASTRFNPIMGYCTPSTIFPCTQIPPTTTSTAPPTSMPTSTDSSTTSSPIPSTTSPTTTASVSSTTSSPTPSTTLPTTTASTIASTATTTSTVPPTTAAATTTEAPCTANGRFPIADPNCQMYYFCNINGPEPIKYQLKCPNDLRFDPKKQLCVRSDKCPVS
ncbi:PREDICTED: integumentary mucin C.1-like [Dufourea novaeangliae]|uniref:integumentary mucin C.1-like n=1 Tax=Dufourea novaeangliae TaxID=178035 RepID=UPI000767A362|nr:PREDICTED: integumentary mucin C.1-like [Dufourea novaeangliae]